MMNYYNPYQIPNYTNPIQPTIPTTTPTTTPTYTNGGNLYFVGSEDEAKNWIVGPNQTVYLLDRNNARLYIKTVEKNGMAEPLEVFTLGSQEIKEEPTVEYATKEDLEKVQAKLKSEIRKIKPLGKKSDNE